MLAMLEAASAALVSLAARGDSDVALVFLQVPLLGRFGFL